MKSLLVVALIVVALVLSSCINVQPEWIVKMSATLPGLQGICTGIVVDRHSLITASHCEERGMYHTVLRNGQDIEFDRELTEQVIDQDFVVLRSDEEMILMEYAEIGEPEPGLARIYGFCPYYRPDLYRPVEYVSRDMRVDRSLQIHIVDTWQVASSADHEYACAGDSGGAVVQNGKVVGLLVTLESELSWPVYGSTIHSVPIDCVMGLYRNRNKGGYTTMELAQSICK